MATGWFCHVTFRDCIKLSQSGALADGDSRKRHRFCRKSFRFWGTSSKPPLQSPGPEQAHFVVPQTVRPEMDESGLVPPHIFS
jgi:hypothetical protein